MPKKVVDQLSAAKVKKTTDVGKHLDGQGLYLQVTHNDRTDTYSKSWLFRYLPNGKHRAQRENTLQTYAEPKIGHVPVEQIGTAQVLDVLTPIWEAKTETAARVRQRVDSVLDYATARGYRSGKNPARWRGHLDKLLAKSTKVKKVKYHPALRYADVQLFMDQLRASSGTAARALELTILTATRTNEVIGAKWQEFDLDAGTWVIPASRMKALREHTVPLSK